MGGPEVPVTPGTRLYAWSRNGEADGAVWPGDGEYHIVYHDSANWKSWIHTTGEMPLTKETPLAACGRPGYWGAFWSGNETMFLMHVGRHNDWIMDLRQLRPRVLV